MATRESIRDGWVARWDHGAQYFTTRSPEFADQVQIWVQQGVVQEWCRGFGTGNGHPRYVGINGLNSVPQQLAAQLPVRCHWEVKSLLRVNQGWRVTSSTGETVEAKALIVTAPMPQTRELFQQSPLRLDSDLTDRLAQMGYDPCLAAMVRLATHSRLPPPGGMPLDNGPIRWIVDNQQKGISPDECTVTIHASPEFSRTWMAGDHDEAGRRLVEAAHEWIGKDVQELIVHGWRYSMPARTDPDRALVVCDDPPLVLGGDVFNGPKVEGAFLSGRAAAEMIWSMIR